MDTDSDTSTPGTGRAPGVPWERQQCGGVAPSGKKGRAVHLPGISTMRSPQKSV